VAGTPVLIVGAGPTGLVLALGLARRGVPFRMIDENPGPGEHSRAMALQARTLEFYRQFGFADALLEQGVKVPAVHLRESDAHGVGHERLRLDFADLGDGISPYPFAFAYPQDDHERFLLARLCEAGGDVEWNTRLVDLVSAGDGVHATVARAAGADETIAARWLCGCDGARSRVRESLALGFPGGTYEERFYVADVEIAGGLEPDLHITLGDHLLVLMLPVRSSGMQRFIGLVPPELAARDDLAFEDLRGRVEPLLGVTVTRVNWFATYRVHHRVAERFRVGNALLLGDAAHIHSPVGGQGMNAGIGDAVNLAWKLAHVIQGRAEADLLDTYESERIGFARSLVASTDRAFTPLVATGPIGELTRRVLAPLFLELATRVALTRHTFFRTLSQAGVHYPASALSEGRAGHVHGGDRLPWVPTATGDNFAPLRSLDWQVQVFGRAGPALSRAGADLGLPLFAFPFDAAAERAGFARDAAYLVRPDGYVALAAQDDAPARLAAYAAQRRLRLAPARDAARGAERW